MNRRLVARVDESSAGVRVAVEVELFPQDGLLSPEVLQWIAATSDTGHEDHGEADARLLLAARQALLQARRAVDESLGVLACDLLRDRIRHIRPDLVAANGRTIRDAGQV